MNHFLIFDDVLEELVILHAPCLEILIVFGPASPISIKVASAPKLILLGYVPLKTCDLHIGGISPAHQVELPSSSS
jgi:hypothetical protein